VQFEIDGPLQPLEPGFSRPCCWLTDKHRQRPRDPNQLGKLIVDISAGEKEDPFVAFLLYLQLGHKPSTRRNFTLREV
jgi:hypothetical protein